jgi:integrase/recombinase XerD
MNLIIMEVFAMMTLRKRFIEDLQLQGMAARTQQAYVRAVRQLAEHYHKSPELITEEELRQYFLYVKNTRKWSRATITQALCGIKRFYEQTLKWEWPLFAVIRPPKEQKLPVILTRAEVHRLVHAVHRRAYRTCLTTIYSCGLRLREGTRLQVSDIDSGRMLVHVRHGKGGKDRYVPLPQRTLDLLREYWKRHRNPVWLFPAGGVETVQYVPARKPVSPSTIQKVFRLARQAAGIRKPASVHTLRHSYATHLLIRVNLSQNREHVIIIQPCSTLIRTMFQNLRFKLLNAIRSGQREDDQPQMMGQKLSHF